MTVTNSENFANKLKKFDTLQKFKFRKLFLSYLTFWLARIETVKLFDFFVIEVSLHVHDTTTSSGA